MGVAILRKMQRWLSRRVCSLCISSVYVVTKWGVNPQQAGPNLKTIIEFRASTDGRADRQAMKQADRHVVRKGGADGRLDKVDR
jgi:hypothetical protein